MKRLFFSLFLIAIMISPFFLGASSVTSLTSGMAYNNALHPEFSDMGTKEESYDLSSIPTDTSVVYNQENYYGELPVLLNETHTLVNASMSASAGSGVLVAILSTGINETHPMLDDMDDDCSTDDPKVVCEFNAYSASIPDSVTTTYDYLGRGTALASIIAGTGAVGGKYNSTVDWYYPIPHDGTRQHDTWLVEGFVAAGSQMGLAPGARLMDVKITNDIGMFDLDSVIFGIEWAVEHGADIILLDAQGFGPSHVDLLDAIDKATELGVLVIVPAGDYYPEDNFAPYYTINNPASSPSALTVGATTELDVLYSQSCRGPVPGTEISKPDVVAPGYGVLCANHEFLYLEEDNPGAWEGQPGDPYDTLYYELMIGTRPAAAVVAGISARLIESFPGASPTAIKLALRKTADDLGYNEMAQGKGKINFGKALALLQNTTAIPDNWINNVYNASFDPYQLSYLDLEDMRILIDGSYTTATWPGGWSTRDWSEMPNGNLTTLGTPGWQHPYDDSANQYIWYNFSFPGTFNLVLDIYNVTLRSGDNFTAYYSDIPNDPNPNTWFTRTTNSTTITPLSTDSNYFYFRFGSNGDNLANDYRFGIYGDVVLQFYARTARVGTASEFEFDSLASILGGLGASVEWWYSANALTPPSATILEYYDLYIIGQPLAGQHYADYGLDTPSRYYHDMSGNISQYVANGGNILFVGDEEPCIYNNATLGSFGIEWWRGGVGGYTTDFINHALTTYPFEIQELLIDAPLAHISGTGTTIVNDGNLACVIAQDPGGAPGRNVFVSDEDIFNDELWLNPFGTTAGRANNSQFAMNIIYWLLEVVYQSGTEEGLEKFELVNYSVPQIMIDDEPWRVDFEIMNVGNETSQALIAFGIDWTVTWADIGSTLTAPGHDNANNTWHWNPDGDIGVVVTNTTIEFYYNISETYPIEEIALPYVLLNAIGVNRTEADCYLYVNDVQISPLHDVAGSDYIMIYPDAPLYQYNNKIRITVPENISLELDSFRFRGRPMDNSVVQHLESSILAPGEKEWLSFTYTPDVDKCEYREPHIIISYANLTHAVVDPGFYNGFFVESYPISVKYGHHFEDYYYESNSRLLAVLKGERRGPLPILYDITPDAFDSSTSTKIAQFPGDVRVDGLTIMSSVPLLNSSLELTRTAPIAGLGNVSESKHAIGSYAYATIAPNFFRVNDTWARTTMLYLEPFNHTSTQAVFQIDIPLDITTGAYPLTLNIYSGNLSIYNVSTTLDIAIPSAKFLLYDTTDTDTISTTREYDKLWDQVFEVWNIATTAGYDVDSLYQETWLFNHRNHREIDYDDFLDLFISEYCCDEESPYAGLLVVGQEDQEALLQDPDQFMMRGGTLIQFGVEWHIGPTFSETVQYMSSDSLSQTIVSSGETDHRLMSGIENLLYLGGGYMQIDQDECYNQHAFEVLSGYNWPFDNLSHDLAYIYHEPIVPIEFCYDTGKYRQSTLYQEYNGSKIVVGTDVLAQSWFLEYLNVWARWVLQDASMKDYIPDEFNITSFDNAKFIENVFDVAANQAPTIESVTVIPEHVDLGGEITVSVVVSDDETTTLTVLAPERLESGFLYVELEYDASSGAYVGSFPIINERLLNEWNILVFDDLYRGTWAVDYCKRHLIPQLNFKPQAFALGYSDSSYLQLSKAEKGDLISVDVYYQDYEDYYAIECNVSLIHYIYYNETEVIFWQLLEDIGMGRVIIDTTDFTDGTYVLLATVTDTDGGQGVYILAGFNIGEGTLYKVKTEEPPPDMTPLILTVGGVGVGVAAVAAIIFVVMKRRAAT